MRLTSILRVTTYWWLLGVYSVAAAQDWGRMLGDQVKQRANRAAQEAVDKGLDAAEDAVRCVVTDQACIDRARQSGQDVVLTNKKGEPLPPERQPQMGTATSAATEAAAPIDDRPIAGGGMTAAAQAVAANRDGNNVQLEKELLQLSQNSLAHTVETQLVTSGLLKLRLAITGRTS